MLAVPVPRSLCFGSDCSKFESVLTHPKWAYPAKPTAVDLKHMSSFKFRGLLMSQSPESCVTSRFVAFWRVFEDPGSGLRLCSLVMHASNAPFSPVIP